MAIDPFEAVYRVYVTAIVGGIALWVLSGLVGDHRVDAAAVARVRDHGGQIVGAVVAFVWAVGIRSGGRGGPLVIEAPDVRHVLMSPVSRSVILRPMAWRQLRFAVFVAAIVGAVGGLLAFRRLPGSPVEWVACGAATGLLAVGGALGLAMAVSGRRLGAGLRNARWVAGGLALATIGWSGADALTRSSTSPATWIGQLAVSPLGWRPGVAVGVVVAVAVVLVGVFSVGGCSIEAAERRATLAGQIRFAATLRDIRTVVVLRRQLAQELPRQRRRRRVSSVATEPLRKREARWPAWRRGWQGIARFPAVRIMRLALLGAVAGAAAIGAWRGTTPLLGVVGLASYVAALDAVEPLAQEIDHPDRCDSYPVSAGNLYVRLVAPSLVVMIGVAVVAVTVAGVLSDGRLFAWGAGAIVAIPAAAAALAGAVTSVIQGPPPVASSTDSLLPPEIAGARAMVRTLWPPALATIGAAPLLAGRHPKSSGRGLSLIASSSVPVIVLVAGVGIWVHNRERIHAAFHDAFAEVRRTSAAPADR